MNKIIFALLFLGLINPVYATPIEIGKSNFLIDDTLVDLNDLESIPKIYSPKDEGPLYTQYFNLGLEFSLIGGGWAFQQENTFVPSGDSTNIIARNGANQAVSELHFSEPVSRVGFDVGSNRFTQIIISTLLNDVITGTFTYYQNHDSSSFSSVFRGFQDTTGIDAVRFYFPILPYNFIDNILFEPAKAISVPDPNPTPNPYIHVVIEPEPNPISEPPALALMGLGLLGLFGVSRKRK